MNGFMKVLGDVSIDRIFDKVIEEMNDFIKKEKSKIEHVLSRENMSSMNIPEENMDYVITEIKSFLLKINISDEVYRTCKYDSRNLSAFLWNEYCKHKDGYIECEKDIKQSLFLYAEALIKLVRESENFGNEILIHVNNSVDDRETEVQKISKNMQDYFNKLDAVGQMVLNILWMILKQNQNMNTQYNDTKNSVAEDRKFKNNKKDNYIKNWNHRLFLHLDNEENPITLADAFIMPDYKIYEEVKRMGVSADDTLDKIIEKFVKYDMTTTMLILGVPGIGKSTITSWIANKYIDDDRVIILRFRDWKRNILNSTSLLGAICNKLNCEEEDLENNILVLDGFDEMKALDIRDKLLNDFFNDMNAFENFKCIMTSRLDYIDSRQVQQFQNVLELREFDMDKVEIFVRKITGKELDIKDDRTLNLEVLGIPAILYMAVMSDIDINGNVTKPELYNCIFSENKGIFYKFSDKDMGYDGGKQILRDSGNLQKWLLFLREIAFSLFEKGDISLNIRECKIPKLEFNGALVTILEFPIKHLFENTEESIEFIHKTIYEYFVSEYIFYAICEGIKLSEKEFAGVLGNLLKRGNLSREICEFLKYKMKERKLLDKFDTINSAFQVMLQDGMTYHTGERYKNVMDLERNIFANMLEIIHLKEDENLVYNESMRTYLFSEHRLLLNLSNMDFSGCNLVEINFSLVDLGGANFKKTNLNGAYLDAYMAGANLVKAELEDVSIKKNTYMNATIWHKDDIPHVVSLLKKANFSYIIVENEEGKHEIVCRYRLFPEGTGDEIADMINNISLPCGNAECPRTIEERMERKYISE